MERIKITLCEACDACPAVEISDEGVIIGENGNIVKLTHAEWNDLVARIRRGEPSEVRALNTREVTGPNKTIGAGRTGSLLL